MKPKKTTAYQSKRNWKKKLDMPMLMDEQKKGRYDPAKRRISFWQLSQLHGHQDYRYGMQASNLWLHQ
jgi:hypothetical protein